MLVHACFPRVLLLTGAPSVAVAVVAAAASDHRAAYDHPVTTTFYGCCLRCLAGAKCLAAVLTVLYPSLPGFGPDHAL